jgi:hypothetical protein
MDTWVWVVIVVVVVVVLAVAALEWSRRRRTKHLRGRFGSEYERTVEQSDSRRAAEHDLRDRETRHDELELRPLAPAVRERYREEWHDVQERFVDRPQVAAADADQLLTSLMRERGYPVEDFEARRGLVAVDHPDVVEQYRFAHEMSRRSIEGRATTEDLRQAVVAYRSLFEELLVDADANA